MRDAPDAGQIRAMIVDEADPIGAHEHVVVHRQPFAGNPPLDDIGQRERRADEYQMLLQYGQQRTVDPAR